nr:MAG TPA: hypothetical protein [Bacteriophage sp.]
MVLTTTIRFTLSWRSTSLLKDALLRQRVHSLRLNLVYN